MIQLNTNITKTHPQTGTYEEWLHHINHNPIYNNILEQLIQHIETKVKPINKKLINRILSYYLLPQNHNNLTFGSLHQFDKQIKTSIHELAKKGIIIAHFENYNTYYKFSNHIEQLIIRLYNLETILSN
jgi:hypothetical protein